MKWKTRITVLLTALFGHKLVWATTTGVIAGVTASQVGRDPMPWIIGAMAVTVVYAHKKEENKEKALANGVISVFLGGIGAPYSGQILSQYVSPIYANDWVLAGILGAGWPWLLPIALAFIKRKSEKDDA